MEKRGKRKVLIVILFVILAILYFFRDFFPIINSISVVGLILVFYILDRSLNLQFEGKHYFFTVFIAVTGILLSSFYFLFPLYDKLLHIILPMMFASIVFFMVSKTKLNFKLKLTFTFFIVMAFIGLFELGEYVFDIVFDLTLQGVFLRTPAGMETVLTKIDDTMIDMALGLLGTLLHIISVYFFFSEEKS
tara:strand:+ start:8517 stop:9089 length:573 start_codon:yes stop_codon:yes gene_type:complete